MQTPDAVIAKDNWVQFAPHPEGQYAAICVDVVNMGDRRREFLGHVEIKPSLILVFATGERREDGNLYTIQSEFNVSMNERASLRKFLESWRGKKYTAEQAAEGVPVHKLCGVGCLLTIEHMVTKAGRTYGNINSIAPLPKAMQTSAPKPADMDYTRPDWLNKRKDEYAAEVARERAMQANGNGYNDGAPPPGDDEEEIPF